MYNIEGFQLYFNISYLTLTDGVIVFIKDWVKRNVNYISVYDKNFKAINVKSFEN